MLTALEEAHTPALHIALQDGFDHDTVVVRVNGQEVFNTPGVTRDSNSESHGPSSSKLPKASPIFDGLPIEERVSRSGYRCRSRCTWDCLSRDGRLTHRLSSEPFGYL